MQNAFVNQRDEQACAVRNSLRVMPEGSQMRKLVVLLLTIIFAVAAFAQQQTSTRIGSGSTTLGTSSELPIAEIGKDDLIGIIVYDAPELTRTARVDSAGEIRLPMLKDPIGAEGLFPAELETVIRTTLIQENILVDPIVTVTVVEYRSRPVHVYGAVRNPTTFQAAGTVTLLDAISQAGGLTENAGSEILVSHQQQSADGKTTTQIQRISVQSLFTEMDASQNVELQGGEDVRVIEAGKVYVVGNVKKPCVYSITDGSESSLLKAMALSEGLESASSHTAYIYRTEAGGSGKREIPVDLKNILDRKSPDVPLIANDILYVPQSRGRKAALTILDRGSQASLAVATGMLYWYH